MAEAICPMHYRRSVRHSNPIDVETINSATATQYWVTPAEYVGFRGMAASRDIAVYLSRRYNRSTLVSTIWLVQYRQRFGLHPARSQTLRKIKRSGPSIPSRRKETQPQSRFPSPTPAQAIPDYVGKRSDKYTDRLRFKFAQQFRLRCAQSGNILLEKTEQISCSFLSQFQYWNVQCLPT